MAGTGTSSELQNELAVHNSSPNRYALLVGCNYPNQGNRELHGCINDALGMQHTLLTRFGFKPACIELLTDEAASKVKPTRPVMMAAMDRLIGPAKRPGDVLFFQFSGHGYSDNKMMHYICPNDMSPISSVDFRLWVNRVPKGASFIFLADSCCSGGLIDKEKMQIGPHHLSPLDQEAIERVSISPPYKPKRITHDALLQHLATSSGLNSPSIGVHLIHLFGSENVSPMFTLPAQQWPKPLKKDQGILLSGCQPNEFTYDIPIDGKFQGAFTYAVQLVLKNHPAPITNFHLVQRVRPILEDKKIRDLFDDPSKHQHPCLYCSDHNAHAFFLCMPH